MLAVENWLRFAAGLISNPEPIMNEPNSTCSESDEFRGFPAAQVARVAGEAGLRKAKQASRTNPNLSPLCRHILGVAVTCHGL
jgi:hypothetical protein